MKMMIPHHLTTIPDWNNAVQFGFRGQAQAGGLGLTTGDTLVHQSCPGSGACVMVLLWAGAMSPHMLVWLLNLFKVTAISKNGQMRHELVALLTIQK